MLTTCVVARWCVRACERACVRVCSCVCACVCVVRRGPAGPQRFLPAQSKSGQRRLVKRCRATGALLSAAVPVSVLPGRAAVTSGRPGARLGDMAAYLCVCDQVGAAPAID